jgi:hypothetical protein
MPPAIEGGIGGIWPPIGGGNGGGNGEPAPG